MVFAALLLLCPCPQIGNAALSPFSDSVTVRSVDGVTVAHANRDLPAAPEPKIQPDAVDDSAPALFAAANSAPEVALIPLATPAPIVPRSDSLGLPAVPPKPAFLRTYETPRQRKMWYGLAVAGHSAAVFDAWSTRRAISGGYGTEANPLLRPFSHSSALYVATQVSPAFMDYLGRRMMTSRRPWVRKMWWFPQTAGASFSFSAGIHNANLPH